MKKSAVLLTFFTFSSTILFAQVNTNYTGPRPEVTSGAKSFVFMYTPFQSNFDPVYISTVSIFPASSMDLFGAGFRYFFTSNIALGAGLNFGTGSSEILFTNGDRIETTATSFGVAVEGNYHFMALYSVSPYFGANVNIGRYSTTEEESEGGVTTTTETSGSGFGVGVHLGFDWFFTEGLSLGGRYALGFQSLGKPELSVNGDTVEGASSNFFGISSASVILNVHL
jgi:hypothetical protein